MMEVNTPLLGDRLKGMVAEALNKYKVGFAVLYWDVQFSFGPVEVAPGQQQIIPTYWLTVMTPSPLLGQPPLAHITLIPLLIHEQEGVNNVVIDALDKLRSAKAKALSLTNGKQE